MKRFLSVTLALALLCPGMMVAYSESSYFDDVMNKAQEKEQAPDTHLTLPLTFDTFYERFAYMCDVCSVTWDEDNVTSLGESEDGMSMGFNIDNLIIWTDTTEEHNVISVSSFVSKHHGSTSENNTRMQAALVATLGYGIPASDGEAKTMRSDILDDLVGTIFSTALLSDTYPSSHAYLDSDIADYTYELESGSVWLKATMKQS